MLAKDLKRSPNHQRTTNEHSLDDSTLWQSFKKGNDLAFSVLYNKYVQRLYNYGMHACKDRNLVLDCLQEMFTNLWDKRENLSEVTSVNSYLFKSFRRLLLSRLTANRKFSKLPEIENVFEFVPSNEDSIVEAEWENERYTKLTRSLDSLTKRQREALFLRFFNQLSYEEVAAVMELHIDSVYNLTSKAIDILRKKLKAVILFPILFCFLF